MNRRFFRRGCTAAALLSLLCSCSVTRYVPEGQYLLVENKVETDKQTPKSERIKTEEMEKYVRQTPNKRFLGTNLPLWIYNLAKPGRNTVFARMWRRIGQAPVLLDTTLTARSASNIASYMHTRGFFDATESYTVDTAHHKARVTYRATQGRPYYIGKISYDFRDEFLRPVIRQDSASTLLRTGDVFDMNVLDRERLRITQYLKNRGYYNFTINNISYSADSTAGDHRIDLTMIVKQYLSGYDAKGEPLMENNRIYRLRDISVYPDYDPTVAATDSVYRFDLDTTEYRGLNIVYRQKPRIRKPILRRTINLYPNYLYNADEVKRAYDNIMRLGYYKSASILFTEVADTAQQNQVTFIGGGEEKLASTTEGYLDCAILCTPALRQSYKIELEASTTSNFYGLAVTLGYQNRNLFRGVELFDISIKGGYEFIRAQGKKSSFEVGGTTSLSFPRFILPFRIDRFHRLSNPRTKFELSVNSQRRPYYHRTLSGINWGYSWGNGKHATYTLRPVDVSLVKMSYVDENFLGSLQNPYLWHSYQSQLIAGISGSYVYNSLMGATDVDRNALNLRVNVETTGNLINGLTHLFSQPKSGEEYYRLFGIQYSQYFRIDANLSNKIVLNPRNSLVYRLYGGVGVTYGNSAHTSMPFDRLFYCGGSNSMRGWLARTLGPGSVPVTSSWGGYPSQLGNLKLEANLEYRFPVWGFLNGALFFDAGNIWYLKGTDPNPDAIFHFKSFWSQLGLNTGLGARFDFNFFVIRVDWGIKLHNPNELPGQRWIQNFRFRNTALNFGVGYPF